MIPNIIFYTISTPLTHLSPFLQTYALLESDRVSKSAVFSIFTSAAAIAFASTTISVDFDIDPSKRLHAPDFYGYMPDENRLLVFLLMCFMTISHVLMKILACSVLLRLSDIWFFLYMAGDMSLHLLFKLVRGDLRYWIRIDSMVGWVVSVLVRIGVKAITDL